MHLTYQLGTKQTRISQYKWKVMGHGCGIALINITKGSEIIIKGYENLKRVNHSTGTVGVRNHSLGLLVHMDTLRQLARVHLYLYKSFTVSSQYNITSPTSFYY